MRCAVELAFEIGTPADHRAHGAVGTEGYQCGLRDVARVAGIGKRLLDGGLRGLLAAQIERRANGVAPACAGHGGGGLCRDPVDEIFLSLGAVTYHDIGRVGARACDFLSGQRSGIDKAVEDLTGTGAGTLKVVAGREAARRFRQAGQNGGLGERYVAHGLAEVVLRCRVHAVIAGTHVDAVEIERQDFVLGKIALEPERDQRFLCLAHDGAAVVEIEILGDLLRDRRPAFDEVERLEI